MTQSVFIIYCDTAIFESILHRFIEFKFLAVLFIKGSYSGSVTVIGYFFFSTGTKAEKVGDKSTTVNRLTSSDSQIDIPVICNPAKLKDSTSLSTNDSGADVLNARVTIPTIIGVPRKAPHMNGKTLSHENSTGNMMQVAAPVNQDVGTEDLPEYTPLRRLPKNANTDDGSITGKESPSPPDSDANELFKKPVGAPLRSKQSKPPLQKFDSSMVVPRPKPALGAQFAHRRSMPVMNVNVAPPQFGKRESVIESLEKKRRESIGTRLKGLQVPVSAQHKGASSGGSPGIGMGKALPTIIGQKSHGGMLPKIGVLKKRHSSYQPLVPTTFSMKPMRLQHRMSESLLMSAPEPLVAKVEDISEASDAVGVDEESNARSSGPEVALPQPADKEFHDNDTEVFAPSSDKEDAQGKEISLDVKLSANDEGNVSPSYTKSTLPELDDRNDDNLADTNGDVSSPVLCDKDEDLGSVSLQSDVVNEVTEDTSTVTTHAIADSPSVHDTAFNTESQLTEDSQKMDSLETREASEDTPAETNDNMSPLHNDITPQVTTKPLIDTTIMESGDSTTITSTNAVPVSPSRSKPPLPPKPKKPIILPKPTKTSILSPTKPDQNGHTVSTDMQEADTTVKQEDSALECDKNNLKSSDDTSVTEEDSVPVVSVVDTVAVDKVLPGEHNETEGDTESGSREETHTVETETGVSDVGYEMGLAKDSQSDRELEVMPQLTGSMEHDIESTDMTESVHTESETSPSCLDIDVPPVPGMAPPSVPDVAPPMVPDTTPSLVADVTEPLVPDVNQPLVPDMAEPLIPEQAQPLVPDMAEPLIPDMAQPLVPDMAEPLVPDMAQPLIPDMAQPLVPDMAQPLVPDMAQPLIPDMAQPLVPDMAQPLLPDMAPPMIPTVAPPPILTEAPADDTAPSLNQDTSLLMTELDPPMTFRDVVSDEAPQVMPNAAQLPESGHTELMPDSQPSLPKVAPPLVVDLTPSLLQDDSVPSLPTEAAPSLPTAAPSVPTEAAPSMPTEAEPSVSDETSPLVSDTAPSLTQDEAPPSVQDDASPLVQDAADVDTPMVPDVAPLETGIAPPPVPEMAPPPAPHPSSPESVDLMFEGIEPDIPAAAEEGDLMENNVTLPMAKPSSFDMTVSPPGDTTLSPKVLPSSLDTSPQLSVPEISIHPPTPTQDLKFDDNDMLEVMSDNDEGREGETEVAVSNPEREDVSCDTEKTVSADETPSETFVSESPSGTTDVPANESTPCVDTNDDAVSLPSDMPQLPPGPPPTAPPTATPPPAPSDLDLHLTSGSMDLSDMSHFDSSEELEGNFMRSQLPQTSSPMMHCTQKEEMSEGRGSLLSSPDVNGPLSPTPSDSDSGIYTSRTETKSETGQ